jgi:hypothetical protein
MVLQKRGAALDDLAELCENLLVHLQTLKIHKRQLLCLQTVAAHALQLQFMH